MVPVATEQGIGFAEDSGPEIVVTDPSEVRPVTVEEHEQISLERLQQIAYEEQGAEGAD